MSRAIRSGLFALGLVLVAPACGGDDDSGENRDDGGGGGGDDGGGNEGPVVAFRLTDLDLLDPHAFAQIGACNDVTAVQNDGFETDINEDNEGPDADDPDGLLDLSGLAVFRPLDQAADEVNAEVLLGADCTAPIETTTCSKGDASSIQTSGSNDSASACDVVLADTTTDDYDPSPAPAPAPCFAVAGPTGVLEFGVFELSEVAGAATYDGDPATGLANGVLRGFLSEEHADAAMVDVPLLGEVPLSSLLPGGTDCCAEGDDRDTDSDGASGWYVYLTFTAVEVPYSE
ncbi:MAG TPA: hypothetical protein VIG06_26780 [Kofleriaceae bacterium]|jgi:hypothetical protein